MDVQYRSSSLANPPASLLAVSRLACRRRELLAALIRRELVERWRGTLLGILGPILLPLLMLGIYTLVLGTVLGRHATSDAAPWPLALTIYAGLLLYQCMADCLQQGPGAIARNPAYVGKVVFPLELPPLALVIKSLLIAWLHTGIWLLWARLGYGPLPASAFLILLVPLLLAPFLLAAAFALSALGLFLRDLTHFTVLASLALLFLSPVFYGLKDAPAWMQPWLQLNPLTVPIETQRALLSGSQPDLPVLIAYLFAGLICAWIALYVFQRLRKGFADVI
jgi:lipopolysaccharide transport system permease protein